MRRACRHSLCQGKMAFSPQYLEGESEEADDCAMLQLNLRTYVSRHRFSRQWVWLRGAYLGGALKRIIELGEGDEAGDMVRNDRDAALKMKAWNVLL